MKKSPAVPDEKPREAIPVPPEPAEYELGLEEFCRRLSLRDARVELISGFYAWALSKHLTQGLESDFRVLYKEFEGLPA